jgi:hypothetical protein
MHDAGCVGGVNGLGQGAHQLGRRAGGPRLAMQPAGQASAGEQFEGTVGPSVVGSGIEHLDDPGVLEAGDGLGFGPEPAQETGAGVVAGEDHLEGDETIQLHLAGAIDDAHAAASELTQDLVARHSREGSRHRRTGATRIGSSLGEGNLGFVARR